MKNLYIFKACGEYFGGAAGVVAETPEAAATLLESYLAAACVRDNAGRPAYRDDGHPLFTQVVKPGADRPDDDCWVYQRVYQIVADGYRPDGVDFIHEHSG